MANACKERGAQRHLRLRLARRLLQGLGRQDRRGARSRSWSSPTRSATAFEPLAPCCKVVSVAGLFAEAILSIHRRESVSRLFNY